jgi:hypothetical protein
MTRASIEMTIASKTYEAELRNAGMLGHDGMDRAVLAFGAFCGVLSLACEPERDAVWPRTDTTVTGRRA